LLRGEQRVDAFSELSFDHAATHRYLRGNAGDHHRFGLWQIVIRRTAVKHFGFADRIKLTVGAQAGTLGWPVTRGAGAEGLVIVEEESGLYAVVIQISYPFIAFTKLMNRKSSGFPFAGCLSSSAPGCWCESGAFAGQGHAGSGFTYYMVNHNPTGLKVRMVAGGRSI